MSWPPFFRGLLLLLAGGGSTQIERKLSPFCDTRYEKIPTSIITCNTPEEQVGVLGGGEVHPQQAGKEEPKYRGIEKKIFGHKTLCETYCMILLTRK